MIEKLNQLPKEIEKYGAEYAAAKADSDFQKDKKEYIYSTLMNEIPDGTEAAKQRMAKGSVEYLEQLKEIKNAKQKELETKARYEGAKANFDGARSQLSHETAKIQRGLYDQVNPQNNLSKPVQKHPPLQAQQPQGGLSQVNTSTNPRGPKALFPDLP